MYELKIALKYLIPKKRSLSSALISIISVLVISLVVWLVIVFLSVTTGIEKTWLNKLTSLNAPLRISPTPEYYSSYYYLIDSVSVNSDYSYKTIGEKALSQISDPYMPSNDIEIPSFWPKPYIRNEIFIDPVKKAYDILEKYKEISFQDYEISAALMRLSINNINKDNLLHLRDIKTGFLTQMSYLLSYNDKNPNLESLIIKKIDEDSLTFLSKTHDGIFLPKNYIDGGVNIGDKGYLSYASTTSTSTTEQRILVFVAGFYDPGVLPVGNKCLLVPYHITRSINASTATFSPDGTPTNGIYIWTKDVVNVESVKNQIEEEFEKAGIAQFWDFKTYKEFEFSKDLMQQFQSDRLLFSLLAAIILFVACSNIISMLVLLVNDKKKEIAILQSMGASKKSIAYIFGFCGTTLGLLSSLIGSAAAIFTLRHLDIIIKLLSAIQGHAAFNAAFFGKSLPNNLSFEALLFVVIVTPVLSLVAGLIPAIKASKIHPANTLRGE